MTTTSQQWWNTVRNDDALLRAWLRDQYRGEATAAPRIESLRDAYAKRGTKAHRVLTLIAAQERKHASWVAQLLAARGEAVGVDDVTERYWPHVTKLIDDLETGAAVGAHAERMRLERIEVIAADADASSDVRDVFTRILVEGRFHARAFAALAGDAALARTKNAHVLGRAALGLAP